MYEPGRTKYPFHILSDQVERLFTTKQDDGEAIDDYYKRHKQICDNAKGSLGTSFLSDFAKKYQGIPRTENVDRETRIHQR